jgi:uncharacterized delta-60 repeat protein
MKGFQFFCGVVLLSLPLSGHAGIGSVDASFNPPVPNDWVRAVAVQPDGRIIIAGDFTTAGGTNCVRIARLLANGLVDPSFSAGAGPDSYVNSVALQPDGKILIAGTFSTVAGTPRAKFARLNSDGTLDTGFAAVQPTIASGDGKQIIALADGRSLLVGSISFYYFSPTFIGRNNVMMLTTNGQCDASFAAAPIAAGVFCTAERPGGKVLVGGSFTTTAGSPRTNLVQLDSLGAPDNSFGQSPAADFGFVRVLQPTADGHMMVIASGGLTNYVCRINGDGSLDGAFGSPHADAAILSAAVQPDGKVWIGGDFLGVNDVQRLKVARLNANGSLDSSFDPGQGTGTSVFALTLQSDGKLLMGGAFNCYNNNCLGTVVRLLNDLTANNPSLVGTAFNVSVATVAGKTYSLQHKLTVSDPTWISVLPAVPGDGTNKVLTDPNATNSQSIYRIIEY